MLRNYRVQQIPSQLGTYIPHLEYRVPGGGRYALPNVIGESDKANNLSLPPFPPAIPSLDKPFFGG